MKIINLTQHKATDEQIKNGVVNLEGESLNEVVKLLTFDGIPTQDEIEHRADVLARTARLMGYDKAMIGGALWLMSALEKHLKMNNVQPFYAFSKRESVEVVNDDGSVTKQNVFKHVGFVSV